MALLSVRNLTIDFKTSASLTRVVNAISFDVQTGKTLALVGASGSGKTVTALSILKLLNNRNCIIGGEVLFKDQNLLDFNDQQINKVRGRLISMIFQEPMTALNPLHIIDRQIIESLILHSNLSSGQCRYRYNELLDLVGLASLSRRKKIYPHMLSGGQRQRVMIAMSLANNPQLLIADEPTTALDVTTQAGILNLLKDLQNNLNLAILLISHDLRVVRRIAHDVCIMNQGQIVEQGVVGEIWSNPQHSYTQSLLQAEPAQLVEPRGGNSILLTAHNVGAHYKNNNSLFNFNRSTTAVLKQINFTIKSAQTLGVVGESGSGKTTLAQVLVKLMPFTGEIIYKDRSIKNLSAIETKSYRRAVQIVFQDPYGSLNPRFMIQQILQEGLDIHAPHLSAQEKQQHVIQAIQDVGLSELDLQKYSHQFSGGQRQRIALARVLIIKPQLIILDEPTSALDRLIQKDILELLANMQQKYNLSYILISHDLSVIKALAHDVMVMKNGEIVEYDQASKVLNQPQHAYTQQLMSATFGF